MDNFSETAPRQLQTGPQQQPERKTKRRSPGRRENDRQQSRRQDRNLATLLFCFLAPASRKLALNPRRLALPWVFKSVFASLTSFFIFLGAHCRPSLSATALKFTLLGYFRKGGKFGGYGQPPGDYPPKSPLSGRYWAYNGVLGLGSGLGRGQGLQSA